MGKEITVDTKKFDILTMELKGFEKEARTANHHALNRTLDFVVTQVGRIVPKVYAIKSKEVKDSFKGGIKRPSKTNLTASLTSKGHTLTLAHFPHSPKAPSKRKLKVKVTIKKAGGGKKINTNPLPFIASTGAKSSDKTQYNIFRREGKHRLPIMPIRTLSIPQMIGNEGIGEQILQSAEQKYAERLDHEVNRSLEKIQKRLEK